MAICPLLPPAACRHTKLVTLKPKYMIENQTGLHMLMKQYGTADPDLEAADAARFARVLPSGSRCAARHVARRAQQHALGAGGGVGCAESSGSQP